MSSVTRRQWLSLLATVPMARAVHGEGRQTSQTPPPRPPTPLDLKDFQPKSMLKVAETKVPRARFPVIDFHTHLGFRSGSVRRAAGRRDEVPGAGGGAPQSDGPGEPADDGEPDGGRRQGTGTEHRAVSDGPPRTGSSRSPSRDMRRSTTRTTLASRRPTSSAATAPAREG